MIGKLDKVSTQTDEAFFAGILAAINGDTEPLEGKPIIVREPINLQQKINSLISRGITFIPTAEKFHLENSHPSSPEDLEYLTANAAGILCHLQQMLLVKEIFNGDPTLLEDYKVEILERELLVTDSAEEIPKEVYEEVVIQVTKEWFTKHFEEFL